MGGGERDLPFIPEGRVIGGWTTRESDLSGRSAVSWGFLECPSTFSEIDLSFRRRLDDVRDAALLSSKATLAPDMIGLDCVVFSGIELMKPFDQIDMHRVTAG